MEQATKLQKRKPPSYWVKKGDSYDCTGVIGPLYPACGGNPEWPMYSFDRAAYTVWNAIAANLNKRGWSDKQIKEWLQSKSPRWALDGELSDMLVKVADEYATKHIS